MTKELCEQLDKIAAENHLHALPAFVEIYHECGEPLNWDATQALRREGLNKDCKYLLKIFDRLNPSGTRFIVNKCFAARLEASLAGKIAAKELRLVGFNVYFLKIRPALSPFGEQISAYLADCYDYNKDGSVEEDHFYPDESSTKRRCFR